MKLNPFKKTPPPPTRRSRLSEELQAKPASFSYRSRRSEEPLNIGRSKARPFIKTPSVSLNFWLQRFGLLILLVAVAISALNIINLSPSAKVTVLDANRNRPLLRPVEDYQAAATQLLKESPWNRTKLTINSGEISQKLQTRFPELSSVNVTLPLLAHRPVVYIEPAQPVLILNAQNGSYVIDSRGKVLISDANSEAITSLDLPQLNDQSGLKVSPSKQALSAKDVAFIQNVLAQLSARQLKVSDLTLPSGASELDIRLEGQPYFVKFNLQSDDPRGEAGTFLATINSLKQKNVTPTQYVDVRVDGRAYYQ